MSSYTLFNAERLDAKNVSAILSQHTQLNAGVLDFSKVPEGSTIIIDATILDARIVAPKNTLVVFSPTSFIQNCEISVFDLLVEGHLESENLTVLGDIELTASATTIGQCERAGRIVSHAIADKDSMAFLRLKPSHNGVSASPHDAKAQADAAMKALSLNLGAGPVAGQ